MIDSITRGVSAAFTAFITANYATATDGTASIAIYLDPDFDPTDPEKYKRILKGYDASAVIWGVECSPDSASPTRYLRLRYTCNLTLIRKSANQWDATNRKNRVLQGSASDPKMNSHHLLATAFAAYMKQNKLVDGATTVSFTQSVDTINEPVAVSDFLSVTCEISALHMYSTTLSITPV